SRVGGVVRDTPSQISAPATTSAQVAKVMVLFITNSPSDPCLPHRSPEGAGLPAMRPAHPVLKCLTLSHRGQARPHRYCASSLPYGAGAGAGSGSLVTRNSPHSPAVLPKEALSRYR